MNNLQSYTMFVLMLVHINDC